MNNILTKTGDIYDRNRERYKGQQGNDMFKMTHYSGKDFNIEGVDYIKLDCIKGEIRVKQNGYVTVYEADITNENICFSDTKWCVKLEGFKKE